MKGEKFSDKFLGGLFLGIFIGLLLGLLGGYFLSYNHLHFWKVKKELNEKIAEAERMKELLPELLNRADKVISILEQNHETRERSKLWNRLTVSLPMPKGPADE